MEVSLASLVPAAAAPPVRGRDRDAAITATAASRADDGAPRDRVTVSWEAKARASTTQQLSAKQQAELTGLRQRDTEVRQHEASHQGAAGALAGGASFSYQTGPDGRSYAVGGEVPIHVQAGRTPDETIANARKVRHAALAPTDPSAQDLSVAAEAASVEQAAQTQKALLATRAYARSGARRSARKGAAASGHGAGPSAAIAAADSGPSAVAT